VCEVGKHQIPVLKGKPHHACIRQHTSAYVSIRQHTSAYVSIRQHTSAYVSIRQHTSAYAYIRQHTSAYVSILKDKPTTPASRKACQQLVKHVSS
jgi:hypothetical protein